MRKLVILLMLLAALLVAQVAQAGLVNEISNGNFNSGFTGWTNPADGHIAMNTFSVSGTTYAGLDAGKLTDEAAIYQIANDQNGGGWNDNYNNKWWQLSVNAYVSNGGGEVYLFYWNNNSVIPTTLPNPDNPTSGWVALVAGEPSPGVQDGGIDATGAYQWTGTILGFQPKYFAVALEAQDYGHLGAMGFTDVELYGQCVVPVPPAVWLFGSGLVGLFGLRRKFKA